MTRQEFFERLSPYAARIDSAYNVGPHDPSGDLSFDEWIEHFNSGRSQNELEEEWDRMTRDNQLPE